mmetsp:Transcript_17595/g.43918  ORF Transcript_17595/g.43918 Transcript_17595/m.43918 type:complete len:120 (-) Transcript_17595:308-667(-)
MSTARQREQLQTDLATQYLTLPQRKGSGRSPIKKRSDGGAVEGVPGNAAGIPEWSKPVAEPRPGFFEELIQIGDMPNFFRWKKTIALDWVAPEPLTLDREVLAKERAEFERIYGTKARE